MSKYFEKLNPLIKDYFHILSSEIPDFLYDYINTPELQRIDKISIACGTNYTKIFNHKFFYSNLEHSIGVALIIWNFTKDKKQTIAGLLHDIATPVFKHCIDFMNGDHEKQESTEELTTKIISESKEIMNLLKRDEIKIEEVDDYHIYPIADNDTPKVSADRLEYTFSNGMFFDSKEIWDLKKIKRFYDNIVILKDENGIDELGFEDKAVAEEFISYAKDIWPFWITNEDKLAMQFLADIVRKMIEKKLLTVEELYILSEKEIINKIENCQDENISKCFKLFENTKKINESQKQVKDKYCVNIKAKKRYIVPLVKVDGKCKRINEISDLANKYIENYLKYETKKYAYLDFKF